MTAATLPGYNGTYKTLAKVKRFMLRHGGAWLKKDGHFDFVTAPALEHLLQVQVLDEALAVKSFNEFRLWIARQPDNVKRQYATGKWLS